MSKDKQKKIDFEQSIKQLNELVEKMERGDTPLETALNNFETGIKLIRECQTELNRVEQKIQILTQNNNTDSLEDFKPND
jgi:exodeoxyribonuclease VII small subunit